MFRWPKNVVVPIIHQKKTLSVDASHCCWVNRGQPMVATLTRSLRARAGEEGQYLASGAGGCAHNRYHVTIATVEVDP